MTAPWPLARVSVAAQAGTPRGRSTPMRLVSRALFVVLVLALLVPSRARARTHVVQPGDSIRAALAQAQPGDRITVLPGVYREGAADVPTALTVTQDDIALVGLASPG